MHKDQAWIIRNAHLWADNDQDLYNRKMAWVKNVARKIINASYHRPKLVPAMEKYLVPEILNKMRESGEFNDTEYEHTAIPKHIKMALAVSLARTVEQEARYEVKHSGGLDKPSMLKKRGFILAAKGYHGVIRKPTKFVIGEGRYPERVNITPIRPGHKKHHYNVLDLVDTGHAGSKIKIHQSGLSLDKVNINNIKVKNFI